MQAILLSFEGIEQDYPTLVFLPIPVALVSEILSVNNVLFKETV